MHVSVYFRSVLGICHVLSVYRQAAGRILSRTISWYRYRLAGALILSLVICSFLQVIRSFFGRVHLFTSKFCLYLDYFVVSDQVACIFLLLSYSCDSITDLWFAHFLSTKVEAKVHFLETANFNHQSELQWSRLFISYQMLVCVQNFQKWIRNFCLNDVHNIMYLLVNNVICVSPN